jgi:hypothetical protein
VIPAVLISSKSDIYHVNETTGNVTINFDANLTHLLDEHRFMGINMSLITNDVSRDRSLFVLFVARPTLLKDGQWVRGGANIHHARDVYFKRGVKRSSSFQVAEFPTLGSDTADIRFSLHTEMDTIHAVHFDWVFGNAMVVKYTKSTKLILSFLVGIMLSFFAISLEFDSESFVQVFCLFLGLAGVFASNPFHYFFPTLKWESITDQTLMAIFVALYKALVIFELDMLRSHSPKPNATLLAILSSFFAFYATSDAAANYSRDLFTTIADGPTPYALDTEKLRALLDFVYAIIASVYMGLAIAGNDGVSYRRTMFFVWSALATVAVTLVSDVVCVFFNVWLDTPRPALLLSSFVYIMATMTLFFMHTGSSRDYMGLEDMKESDHHVIVLDQLSEGGLDEDNEEEDRDESAEE